MSDERQYRLSEVADALGVPLARVRTMRTRNQTAMWDAGIDEPERVWRDYSIDDAVAFACVLDLIEKGLAADVAASIVGNSRAHIKAGPHPRAAHHTDVWIGAVFFADGRAHVGGQLCDLLIDIEKKVRHEIRAADDGNGTAVFIVNASTHFRKLKEALRDAAR
ncbi:hypothetical protein [Hyphomicrobium sp.]|uniref:hypothetical protein n=1 Tax=Hyphomicrobium sp. TaxID=82 RepID=UPI002FDF9AFD